MPVFRIVLTKRSTWRGQPEEWSNGYFLNGTAPATRAAADTLAEALWEAERHFYKNARLVQHYYYENPEGTVKWGKDYRADTTPKTSLGDAMAASGGNDLSLEQASVMRAMCGYTSKGKPRYVFKYFHGVNVVTGQPDVINRASDATVLPMLAKFTDGTLPNGAKLCRPDGDLCDTPTLRPYVTTRTLKRRGKRPPS